MKEKDVLREVLVKAIKAAIEEMGMEKFKQCSFFGRADCHKKAALK